MKKKKLTLAFLEMICYLEADIYFDSIIVNRGGVGDVNTKKHITNRTNNGK